MSSDTQDTVSVPAHLRHIPFEVLAMIANNLPRRDVGSLCLVCKHFHYYFVGIFFSAVTIRWEEALYHCDRKNTRHAYSHLSKSDSENDTAGCEIVRPIKAFGHLVRRFTISSCIDEQDLALPPWPPQGRLVTMGSSRIHVSREPAHVPCSEVLSDVLSRLPNVSELKICLDPGFGYLLGPDTQSPPTVRNPSPDTSKWVQATAWFIGSHIISLPRDNRPIPKWLQRAYYQAAFEGSTKEYFPDNQPLEVLVRRAVVMLGGNELLPPLPGVQASNINVGQESPGADQEFFQRLFGFIHEVMCHGGKKRDCLCDRPAGIEVAAAEATEAAPTEAAPKLLGNLIDYIAWIKESFDNPQHVAHGSHVMRLAKEMDLDSIINPWEVFELPNLNADCMPIVPRRLTGPQLGHIFKLKASHDTLLRSYIPAILHNRGRLGHVTKLNFARITSRQLPRLMNADLWTSLESLTAVSIGVVAEWRNVGMVERDNTRRFVDLPMFHPNAVALAFELLEDYIGTAKNITDIHFGWHCGGELASGVSQRGRHVLAAPVALAVAPFRYLDLPHVKRLSFRNCYFYPEALLGFLRLTCRFKLRSVDFESVSLTGPLTRRHRPLLPWNLGAAWGQPFRGRPRAGADLPKGFILQEFWHEPLGARGIPSFTWAGIIDSFFGRSGLANCEHSERRSQIGALRFKSCGYLVVPQTHRVQLPLLPRKPIFTTKVLRAHTKRETIHPVMLKRPNESVELPLDRAGVIICHMNKHEHDFLAATYGLRFGWHGVYSREQIEAAIEDGVPGAGD